MKKKSKSLTFLIAWSSVILWAGLIFYFSSLPELKSGLDEEWDFALRKLAHAFVFAILTFLLFRAFLTHDLSWKTSLILSVIFSLLYALSDEWHQKFVIGREGRLRDVGVDAIGILGMGYILRVIYGNKKAKRIVKKISNS